MLALLGCGMIGVIAAWFDWRNQGPDSWGRSNAIMGFVPEAMGKEDAVVPGVPGCATRKRPGTLAKMSLRQDGICLA